jgi:GNAT superfamily N-acetyltransferase
MGAIAGPEAQVRPATDADHEPAAEALALAFADDPCLAHLLPDPDSRAEKLLAFFASEIETLTPDHRELWVTDDGSAAAIWAPPGRWRVPLGITMSEARRMLGVFGRRLPLALRTLMRLERHHPKSPEHWYLHYLGVEPRRQGKGLGSALMAPVLGRCDAQAIPAHLESSTDRNRVLYERNGFDLTGVFKMPVKGPPVREMWRDPAQGDGRC